MLLPQIGLHAESTIAAEQDAFNVCHADEGLYQHFQRHDWQDTVNQEFSIAWFDDYAGLLPSSTVTVGVLQVLRFLLLAKLHE